MQESWPAKTPVENGSGEEALPRRAMRTCDGWWWRLIDIWYASVLTSLCALVISSVNIVHVPLRDFQSKTRNILSP
jgi:hypothetical protein